jgi:hypothetical protein
VFFGVCFGFEKTFFYNILVGGINLKIKFTFRKKKNKQEKTDLFIDSINKSGSLI